MYFIIKVWKAPGFDEIPNELLKNDVAIAMIHSLFNRCFLTGKLSDDWSKGIISPVPNTSTTEILCHTVVSHLYQQCTKFIVVFLTIASQNGF